jgi:hypothetical protein
MGADVPVTPPEATEVMIGSVAGVAKVKLADAAVPAESVDITA